MSVLAGLVTGLRQASRYVFLFLAACGSFLELSRALATTMPEQEFATRQDFHELKRELNEHMDQMQNT